MNEALFMVRYKEFQYTLGHVVTMINNNRTYGKRWFEDVLLYAMKNGSVPFSEWLITSIEDPEYKRKIIQAVILRQVGGAYNDPQGL